MSDLIKLIQEADANAIDMENAREAVEQAKTSLDLAKEKLEKARELYEQTLAKADDLGVPKAKIKKLIEERTGVLIASGLMTTIGQEERPRLAKPTKGPKKGKASRDTEMPPEDFHHDALEERDVIQLNA